MADHIAVNRNQTGGGVKFSNKQIEYMKQRFGKEKMYFGVSDGNTGSGTYFITGTSASGVSYTRSCGRNSGGLVTSTSSGFVPADAAFWPNNWNYAEKNPTNTVRYSGLYLRGGAAVEINAGTVVSAEESITLLLTY